MSDRPDVTQMVRDLTSPIVHREPIQQQQDNGTLITRAHITTHPSLLDQLANGVLHMRQLEGGGTSATSKPAANIEALDALARIDLAAARWVRDLGEDDPGDTAACVRKLTGLLPSASYCDSRILREKKPDHYGNQRWQITCCTTHAVEADIRSWWTTARVLSDWDSAAWRPRNTCPHCGERSTLRIVLLQEIATCVACEATWSGGGEIRQLAEHVREENGDNDDEGDAA